MSQGTSSVTKGSEGVTHAVATRPTSKIASRRQRWGYVYVAPFAAVFAVFLVLPLGYALWMSLHTKGIATAGRNVFVGADNYVKAFTDPVFLEGLWRVLRFVLVMVPVQILVALVAALLLDTLATRLSQVSRLLIFVPYAIPAVIGALMWGFLYSPRFGPAQDLFGLVGLTAPDFLSSANIFGSLVNIVTWQWVGYYMIIIYAALRSIDPSIYEAAVLDGADRRQIALRIKVPMISSSMVMIVVFALIGTLQFFTEPQVLRSSAMGAIPTDYTPNMYAFATAFNYSQFNYASTLAFSLGFLVFVGSYLFLFLTRKQSGLK
ncbi:sugar ABC transporter permease [Promicromonospora sp. NPDC023987]|uniref:carbohydrate ABC transporter permease n=1 Tax=Promicromonospora sp. NPDC023987 TaxID=3155360 RepID=UPI0033F75857